MPVVLRGLNINNPTQSSIGAGGGRQLRPACNNGSGSSPATRSIAIVRLAISSFAAASRYLRMGARSTGSHP